MPHHAELLGQRARLAGIELPRRLVSPLISYLTLLEKWNRTINLTSLKDPAEAIDRLLLEPLAAARHLPHGARLADLGSGGGSPALPLALALESPQLLMIEARSRKAAFLREAARTVGQPAAVEAVRFEELAVRQDYAGSFGAVSMRAVVPDPPTIALARSLAAPDGLVAIFSSSAKPTFDEPAEAFPLLGTSWLLILRQRST